MFSLHPRLFGFGSGSLAIAATIAARVPRTPRHSIEPTLAARRSDKRPCSRYIHKGGPKSAPRGLPRAPRAGPQR